MDIRDELLKEYIIAETQKILSGETKVNVSKEDLKFFARYMPEEYEKYNKPKKRILRKNDSKGGPNNGR